MMNATTRTTLAILTVAFLALAAGASAGTYMELDGIDGESTAAGHTDWIDIDSFSQKITREATNGVPGPGRSVHGPIRITKGIDMASPEIAFACASGASIANASLDFTRVSDGQSYLRVDLVDAVVTSVAPAISESGGVLNQTEIVEISYSEITWTYKSYYAGGGLKDTFTQHWNAKDDTP